MDKQPTAFHVTFTHLANLYFRFNNRIPGYYGEFKTASQSGAKTNNALFLDVGDDFSYGFDVNEDILRATDITEQTDKSTVV